MTTETLPATGEKVAAPPLATYELIDGCGNIVRIPTDLPVEDGVPMESAWHYQQGHLLLHTLETNWKGRRFYCGANVFIHFSNEKIRNRDFRGPDFYVVLDVEHGRPRDCWAIFEENGRYPDFILELLSKTMELQDLTTKKDVYEQVFRTPEYVCYDPREKVIHGWRLVDRYYRPVTLDNSRMWCESLNLWLGPWIGEWNGINSTWLRFFDKNGRMLPTAGELEAARADGEQVRANVEQARANAAEIDLVRLRAMLASRTPGSEESNADS